MKLVSYTAAGGQIVIRDAGDTENIIVFNGASGDGFYNTSGDFAFGTSRASARVQVSGVNAASTSDAFLAEDNVFTDLFRIKNNGDVITHQTLNFYSDTSTVSDAYGIVEPLIIAYVTGMNLYVSIGVANTDAATIQFNALSAITIKKLHDQDLVTGDIEVGQIIHLIYDGTNFQLVSAIAQ